MNSETNILLIDDDKNSRDVLTSLLTTSGHIVQAVDSAEKLWKY